MEWTCRCGVFAAEADTSGGLRAVCYCNSCRNFAIRTGAEGVLDEAGGSDLFQVAPERMRFLRGAENLSWLRLSSRGPVRWFTTCCNTPVASTLETPAIPFVTLQSHRFANPSALGPVKVRVFREAATGRVPDDGGGAIKLYANFGFRALKSKLSGGSKRNPFFGSDGKPIASGGPVAD
jgi:hypothetical protein